MLPEKHLAWNNSGNCNFWEFILIFIKKTKHLNILGKHKQKEDKEYLKFIGIQGFNLCWLNNCCKHISPPPFDSDSYSTTKPPVHVVTEIQHIFYEFFWDGSLT